MIEAGKSRWKTLLWALAGAALVASVFPLDDRVDAVLTVTQDPGLSHLARVCSKIGEGWVPAVAGLFLAAFFLLRHRPIIAARVFFVVLTCEFTGLVATILRVLVGRTRPLAHAPQGFYGVWHEGHWILGKFEFSSFPSGHAATAAGVAAAAWLVHRGWGAVMLFYAAAVIWSRMALRCHHLSDVLTSTVLSIGLALWLKPRLLPFLEIQAESRFR